MIEFPKPLNLLTNLPNGNYISKNHIVMEKEITFTGFTVCDTMDNILFSCTTNSELVDFLSEGIY